MCASLKWYYAEKYCGYYLQILWLRKCLVYGNPYGNFRARWVGGTFSDTSGHRKLEYEKWQKMHRSLSKLC